MTAPVHLLLVGHGELEGDLRRLAGERGLAGRLHITGWRDDIPACHDAMDVFCLPSRWEGLSYALLEAVASGRPCVSTDVNGSREVLDPGDGRPACGAIVPRDDAGALATALDSVLADDALRARWSAVGPTRLAEGFSVDAMVDGTLAIYREALQR